MTRPKSAALPVCASCGGPKPAGKGRKVCDICRDRNRPIHAQEATRRRVEEARQRRLAAIAAGQPVKRRLAREAPPGTKWCAQCQQYLPLGQFSKAGVKVNAYCRPCATAYHHAARIKREYGITIEQYEALFAAQEGRCWICQRRPGKMRLAVDHDHTCCAKTPTCGKCVRGLLCKVCNQTLIGRGARERLDILLRAVHYLQDPPAPKVLEGMAA